MGPHEYNNIRGVPPLLREYPLPQMILAGTSKEDSSATGSTALMKFMVVKPFRRQQNHLDVSGNSQPGASLRSQCRPLLRFQTHELLQPRMPRNPECPGRKPHPVELAGGNLIHHSDTIRRKPLGQTSLRGEKSIQPFPTIHQPHSRTTTVDLSPCGGTIRAPSRVSHPPKGDIPDEPPACFAFPWSRLHGFPATIPQQIQPGRQRTDQAAVTTTTQRLNHRSQCRSSAHFPSEDQNRRSTAQVCCGHGPISM